MISHPTAHLLGAEAPYWHFYSVNRGKGVTYLMSLNIKRARLLGPFGSIFRAPAFCGVLLLPSLPGTYGTET